MDSANIQVAWRVGTVVFSRIVITVTKRYKFDKRLKALHVRMFEILAYLGLQILFIRDRGRGGAGMAAVPPLFCALAPTFCVKRKIFEIKKRLETSFFPSIFRYILCIFFNF